MKNFKKLIAVVVMAAVCCVLAGPTVVSAEERYVPVCPHQYELVFTDTVTNTGVHEYLESNGSVAICTITTVYQSYSYQCVKCGDSYIVGGPSTETHSCCGQ